MVTKYCNFCSYNTTTVVLRPPRYTVQKDLTKQAAPGGGPRKQGNVVCTMQNSVYIVIYEHRTLPRHGGVHMNCQSNAVLMCFWMLTFLSTYFIWSASTFIRPLWPSSLSRCTYTSAPSWSLSWLSWLNPVVNLIQSWFTVTFLPWLGTGLVLV